MFKIEITETKLVKKVIDREWVVLADKNGKNEYGYAPEIEMVVPETRIVLLQTTETLCLDKIIKAINNLA